MPRAVLMFLEEARENRVRAERARRLAKGLITTDVCENLERYADELEQSALDLEERAAALFETISETRQLSTDIRGLVEETKVRVRQIRSTQKPPGDSD